VGSRPDEVNYFLLNVPNPSGLPSAPPEQEIDTAVPSYGKAAYESIIDTCSLLLPPPHPRNPARSPLLGAPDKVTWSHPSLRCQGRH
jgi:hypothetical protein